MKSCGLNGITFQTTTKQIRITNLRTATHPQFFIPCVSVSVFIIIMTEYELKGYLIDELKKELSKPLNEQHPWLNAIYLVPEIAVFIYNDYPIKYEIVKYLIDKKFLIYKDLIKHQGEIMYRYVLNTER